MRAPLLLAFLVGLVASAGTAYAITTKDYVKRADKVCQKRNTALAKIKPPQSAREIGAVLRRTLQISRPAQRQVEAIPLPRGAKRAAARSAVRLSRQGLNLLAATSRKIDGGADPVRTVRAAEKEALRVAERQSRAWRKLGARHCPVR